MSKRLSAIILYFLLAAGLQITTGNFPLEFFAFPLSAIAAVIWCFILWRLFKESTTLPLTRFLVAPQTSILCILLLIGGSLIIGLFPQLSEKEADSMSGVFSALGCYNFMTSWIFIAILFLFLSNLGVVIIHAFYNKKRCKKRFLLNHIGLWLALFAGFLGSSDTQTLRVPLYKSVPTREAYDMNGGIYYLDYELELSEFKIEYYPNGRPSRFASDIRVGNKQATLEVNHPYSYRMGEDIYLTGYDTVNRQNGSYCIVQIVKQPWKYITVAGILMMLAGAVLLFINGSKRTYNDDKLG